MSEPTHTVSNQYDAYTGYDLLATDAALDEALTRAGAGWARPQLQRYAHWLGRGETFELAQQANRCGPELHAFDARGRRVDQVRFHPAWHALSRAYRAEGLVSLPFHETRGGRWTAWAAGFYLHGQIEQGTLCPASMSTAGIPLLQREPALWRTLETRLYSRDYDPRDLPLEEKSCVWLGMGMTEKQGGSDVRANTTAALPVGTGGRGGEYRLRGHKWFFSAPHSDAHLVTARTPDGGHACFYVPRWRPDGSRNAILVQRLKDKVGNRSNASAEIEFDDAWGVLMGEEGHGIRTIIEMAALTRLTCVIGSAALLRQALVQALAYARRRRAFGRPLAAQPLMQALLADLALESEAALLLALHLADCSERVQQPQAQAWQRILTPAAKFWVCKRAVALVAEAMEVLGGNGYVEEDALGRLYREAPVNSIWEGSGNVMCLDLLRALARAPQLAQVLREELAAAAREDAPLAAEARALEAWLDRPGGVREADGRLLAQRLVLLAQAVLMRRHAPSAAADAFIATRFGTARWGAVAGCLDDLRGVDATALLRRALPE